MLVVRRLYTYVLFFAVGNVSVGSTVVLALVVIHGTLLLASA